MIVEALAVFVTLITLTLLTLEFGAVWSDVSAVERAAQAGARVDSSIAKGRLADYEALRSIDAGMKALTRARVSKVIIYRATSAQAAPPANCLSIAATGMARKGVSGVCNVYSAEQVATASPTGFRGGSITGAVTCTADSWDANWCPGSRSRTRSSTVRPDYVGVYVEVRYQYLTGVIPSSGSTPGITIGRQAVFSVEPCAMGSSNQVC